MLILRGIAGLQGGGMAIEDSFQLALDLGNASEEAQKNGREVDIVKVLRGYQNKRVLRSSAIHGLAGMAAIAASTYKAYMGEGLGPLSWITQYKIPHFGRVCSCFECPRRGSIICSKIPAHVHISVLCTLQHVRLTMSRS